jgi:general secretion pathway protein K
MIVSSKSDTRQHPILSGLSPLLCHALFSQSGAALFMVIWILALLVVIVGQFSFSMRAEVVATRQFKEAAQAAFIAEAGVSRALLELLRQNAATEEDDDMAPADEEVHAWRVNLPLPAVPFAEGSYRVYIDNESGRIDINTADRTILKMLLDSFDLDEVEKDTIVDGILDWRDPDELHRLNGAESDYYQTLPVPYNSKNGPFESIAELLWVRGVTEALYEGGLRDLFTVGSTGAAPGRRRRLPDNAVSRSGQGININAARPEMLAALPEMTADGVDAILTYRQARDFQSLTEVADVLGADIFDAIAPIVHLQMSPYYVIHTEGRLKGSNVRQLMSVKVMIDPTADRRFVVLERDVN